MRKRLLLVPVFLGVLAVGLVGGTVLADGSDEDGGSPWGSLLSRVATILGIDQEQVEDAFQQASREMEDEAIRAKLDRLVEEGVLDREQADAMLEWYASKPDVLRRGGHMPGMGMWGMERMPFGGSGFGHGSMHMWGGGKLEGHGFMFQWRFQQPEPPAVEVPADETSF